MHTEKLAFITTTFPTLIKQANADTTAKWGKMNFQQMVEHVDDFFKVSSNKIILPFVSSPEHLIKLKEFLMSDKAFRENTKAPAQIVPEEPLPVRNADLQIAISKLEKQIEDFVAYFEANKNAVTTHPVFGELNFEEWILLHYKHVLHHSKQFSLVE
jgi:murein L,D-transpeptidase YafK